MSHEAENQRGKEGVNESKTKISLKRDHQSRVERRLIELKEGGRGKRIRMEWRRAGVRRDKVKERCIAVCEGEYTVTSFICRCAWM